jgi:zinc protease
LAADSARESQAASSKSPAASGATAFEFVLEADGIREFRLRANGLRVLLLANPVAPVVTFCVVYHVGSRNEAVGHTGATHLLEHLMFKGTPEYNRERGTAIAAVLEAIGANSTPRPGSTGRTTTRRSGRTGWTSRSSSRPPACADACCATRTGNPR